MQGRYAAIANSMYQKDRTTDLLQMQVSANLGPQLQMSGLAYTYDLETLEVGIEETEQIVCEKNLFSRY